jgi:hypothetical protein
VEVNYFGCGSWYSAVVVSTFEEGGGWMYHIRYSDGGEEETVGADCIRPVAVAGASAGETEEGGGGVESATGAVETGAVELSEICVTEKESAADATMKGYDTSVQSATMFSIKGGGFAEGVPYKHRVGIGGDNTPLMEMYEVLATLGKLYTCVAKNERYLPVIGQGNDLTGIGFRIDEEEEDEEDEGIEAKKDDIDTTSLLEQACSYYNEASECAMAAGKTAIAMKYLEDASAQE